MKKFLLPIALMNFGIASVTATPLFLWDNQEGLIKAESCVVEPSRTSPFRVSSFTGSGNKGIENLRNYNGIRQSHLINGSILKLTSAKKRTNYEPIEVVGVNTNTKQRKNRWFSKRADKGYLFKDSVQPIEDYILEIDHQSHEGRSLENLNLSKKSYWLAESSGSYYNVNCNTHSGSRNYSLFRVYNDLGTTEEPSAFVGVYKDESNIFSTLRTYKLNSLNTNIDAYETSIDLESLIDSSNSVVKNDGVLEAEKELIKNLDSIKPKKSSTIEKDVTTSQGFFEEVICLPSSTLNVRGENLEKVLFKAVTGEKVKRFQSFNNETKEMVIGGTTYNFVQVEFSSREEQDQKVGWVADKFVTQKSKCKYLKATEDQNRIQDTPITGIDDENCCEFPTVKRPTHSYTSGMRMFKARRGGGTRSHAACDLYRYKNEPILSVAPGKVVRGHYYFYQGTYAVEVVHSGGFVVRYGELNGKKAKGVKNGTQVKMGQRVGYMGVVNSGCCRPMLHFELFEGTKKGPLSQSGNKFRRRTDLMNPTPYLKKWEIGKF